MSDEKFNEIDKTLRNLDETVKSLTLLVANQRYETHLDMEKSLTPLHDAVRSSITTIDSKIDTKVLNYVKIFSIVVVSMLSFSTYIYTSDKAAFIKRLDAVIVKVDRLHPQKVVANIGGI